MPHFTEGHPALQISANFWKYSKFGLPKMHRWVGGAVPTGAPTSLLNLNLKVQIWFSKLFQSLKFVKNLQSPRKSITSLESPNSPELLGPNFLWLLLRQYGW